MAGSIRRPGVEVTQEFVSVTPTIVEPSLFACVVAPCFQVIDAFDDSGDFQDDALAGTYRDGEGVVSYALPSLLDEADITGFEDDVRVFLLLGDVTTELNGPSDEEVLVNDGTADFTLSTLEWEDTGALYTQSGVEAGDVVRFQFMDEWIDVPIASVDSDTVLTLEPSVVDENLSGVTYDVVRNPAQFVFSAGVQANAEYGTDANYIRFTAATLKADGVTPAEFIGPDGDDLTLDIVESEVYLSGSDGAVGDCNLTSATATFTTSVGPRGTVVDKLLYIGTGADDGGVFRDILQVVGNTRLVIETGEGVGLSGQTYSVGDDSGATYDAGSGATDATVGAGAKLTVTNGDFLTSIPNTVGVPDQATYVELSTGVYAITNVDDDDTLTYTSTAASVSLTGEDPVFLLETATAADGATGALTTFVSISADFSTLTSPTTKSVNRAETEAKAISAVVDADVLTTAAFVASASGLSFKVVDTTAPLSLSWNGDADKVVVSVERTAGLSSSTYAEIENAIMDDVDPSYNVAVTDVINAAVAGAGTIIGAVLPINLTFDGGALEDHLLLDADLIGSETPTARVYVSYKALRVDVSADALNPELLTFESTDQIEEEIPPISTENPLALCSYFAKSNSTSKSIRALGVGEVTSSKPEGTAEAYVAAFEFLEGHEVYCIVPGSQDPTVHAYLKTHVTTMSSPENKGERIGFFSQALPEYSSAEVIASGTDGNTTDFVGDNPAEFSAGVDFAAAGVTAGDILVVTVLSSSGDSPDVVNGTVGPLYGIDILSVKPGDDFVLLLDGTQSGIDAGWDDLIDVNFTVYRAGVAITSKSDQAEEVALIGEGFAERRMFHHWPDDVTADIEGTEFVIPGYYLAAAWAGKVGQEPPQQGFTNTDVAGFTGLHHSNGYFSNTQLDRMAGGGTFITIQESQSAPLKCRHQLSTDTSAIQYRELSITKCIDYVAKIFRTSLSRQIGKFNVTQSFLDALATSVQGLLRFLIESGTLLDGRLSSIVVPDDAPDTVEITVVIDVPYPCNYIALTLQI